MLNPVSESLEAAPTEIIDQRERLGRALTTLAIISDQNAHEPATDGEYRPADKITRLTSALEIVNDNLLELYEDEPEVPDETETIVLTDEQKIFTTKYAYLIGIVVSKLAGHLPSFVDLDDLKSEGFLGLVDASSRYDDTRGKFGTFAVHRIHGAIVDYLRAQDIVPRSVRMQAKKIARTEARLAAQYGRSPNDKEIARELEMRTRDVNMYRSRSLFGNTVAFEKELGKEGKNRLKVGETIVDTQAVDPEIQLESKELSALLCDAISLLPENMKYAIEAYYFEGKTLMEIGKELGVSESRVCQFHREAVKRLRYALDAQYAEQSGEDTTRRSSSTRAKRFETYAQQVSEKSNWKDRIN